MQSLSALLRAKLRQDRAGCGSLRLRSRWHARRGGLERYGLRRPGPQGQRGPGARPLGHRRTRTAALTRFARRLHVRRRSCRRTPAACPLRLAAIRSCCDRQSAIGAGDLFPGVPAYFRRVRSRTGSRTTSAPRSVVSLKSAGNLDPPVAVCLAYIQTERRIDASAPGDYPMCNSTNRPN